MVQINPLGRNWGTLVNWDDLGKVYTAITVVWSVALIAGILCLVWHRRSPFVRIRNLKIAITSTAFLHIYLVKILLAYTTNGHFLCSAEFWIMSIYLPFGIALFQANVTQLRSIAEQQQAILLRRTSYHGTPELSGQGLLRRTITRFGRLTQAQKSYCFIAVGMIIQLIITAAVYATSPTLQGDWSSYGPIPYNKGQVKCRKTWEWIPSAFWQLFWTWVYGPYELYRIRNIRDAHRWRLQTVLCIISGLPGSPLWIAAVFSTAFKPVNPWFVPPMWLAPGIIVMQFATIFFPIFEIFEHRNSMHKRVDSFSSSDTTLRPTSFVSEKLGQSQPSHSANELLNDIHSSVGRLYSIGALERALLINPEPLLQYAARKDFTAENIVFLTQVRDWRQAWQSAPRNPSTGLVTEDAQVRLFRMAIEIYATSVDDKTADFPINIEGHIRKDLAAVLGPAVLNGLAGFAARSGSNSSIRTEIHGVPQIVPVAPWAEQKQGVSITTTISSSAMTPPSSPPRSLASATTAVTRSTHESKPHRLEDRPDLSPESNGRGLDLPGFDEHVFDDAEASIKYLVLTNTWRKFVELMEKGQYEAFEF